MSASNKARDVIAEALSKCPFRVDNDEVLAGYTAGSIIAAITAAGLRVVPAEPDAETLERVAEAMAAREHGCNVWRSMSLDMRDYWRADARAAYAEMVAGGEK